jgi:hypothetical protein
VLGAKMRALNPGSLLPLAFVLCVTATTPARAQRSVPSGVLASDNALALESAGLDRLAQQTGSDRRAVEIPARALFGVGGALVGLFAGAYVGIYTIPHGPCSCDDPGLDQAIEGAAVGSALLSAVLASAPQFSSSCTPLRRFGYGVLGSVTGAVAGGALGAAVGGAGLLVGYVTGAGVGAGLASGVC